MNPRQRTMLTLTVLLATLATATPQYAAASPHPNDATITAVAGHVSATLVFPQVPRSATLTVEAASAVPPSLVVLGRDELLAFNSATVLMYLAITPSSDVRLAHSLRLTFTIPARHAALVAHNLWYRGAGSDSWTIDGEAMPEPGVRGSDVIAFTVDNLPTTLSAGKTYNFVLAYTSHGAA